MNTSLDRVLESAHGIAAGRYGAAAYEPRAYRDGLVEYAKSVARDGEAPGAAMVRLIDEGDPVLKVLALAARAAETWAEHDRVTKARRA